MSESSTPRDYARDQLYRLESLWSAVQDGDIDAVHDARVATRRIRAALPFVPTASDALVAEVRRIGRALGRVRELDATKALLNTLEPRIPSAAAALAIARREVDGQLTGQRRRLIKKSLHRPRSIARIIARSRSAALVASLWRNWRHELRNAVRDRATHAQGALDRAGAVYMPNRAHSARIAVKKLRYVVEVAVATGVIAEAATFVDLKHAQEALGDLHDMTVLGKLIDNVRFPDDLVAESLILAAVVRSETARLHERYVRRREAIRAACDACLCSVERESVSPLAIPAVAVVALPVLARLYLRQNDEDDGRPEVISAHAVNRF